MKSFWEMYGLIWFSLTCYGLNWLVAVSYVCITECEEKEIPCYFRYGPVGASVCPFVLIANGVYLFLRIILFIKDFFQFIFYSTKQRFIFIPF